MKNHVVAPLVLLTSLMTLVSCTKPVSETVVTPVKTPDVKVEVVAPAPVENPTPTPTETATGAPVTVTTPPVTATPAPQTFTRKQVVSYGSPGGNEEVEFEVTVTDGIISAAKAASLATNDGGKYNQGNFIKGLTAAVVGKKAKDLNVDAIGGASLTTAAFETFARSF